MEKYIEDATSIESNDVSSHDEEQDGDSVSITSRTASNLSPATASNDSMKRVSPLLVLALTSIIMFGLYYLISMPASVRQHLKEIMPQDNFEARFQLLFTLASLPGIVLPFFSGWIVDRIGGRLCLLVLSLLCFLGQMASSIGVEKERWPVTLTGRFIYGLGFESLFVANQAFLATWFEGGRLGMALGVSTASSYIGYLLSFIISPIAANRISVAFSFWLGAMVKAVSVLAAIAIYVLCPSNINRHRTPRSERSRGRVAQIGNVFEPSNSNRNKSESSAHPSTEANECSIADRNPLSVTATGTNEQMVIGASRSCFCSHLQGFSVSFWLLCISCCLVYSTTVPFINLASGLLLERNLFIKVPEECALKHPDRCSSGYLEPADGNEASCPTAATYAPVLPSSLNISSTDSDPSWYKSSYVYEDLHRLVLVRSMRKELL